MAFLAFVAAAPVLAVVLIFSATAQATVTVRDQAGAPGTVEIVGTSADEQIQMHANWLGSRSFSVSSTGAADITSTTSRCISDVGSVLNVVCSYVGVSSLNINLGGGNDFCTCTDPAGSETPPTVIYGGTGNDTIITSYEAYGEDGEDSISGNSAENFIDGGAGNDSLFGAGGDDTLQGNDGDDILTGGAGDDFLRGGAGAHDLVSYAERDQPVTATLGAAPEVTAGGGLIGENDSFDIGVEDLIGGDGDDTLSGNLASNFIAGNGGNDLINIRADGSNVDTAQCGSGLDTAWGDAEDGIDSTCEESRYPRRAGQSDDHVLGEEPVTGVQGLGPLPSGSVPAAIARCSVRGGLARPIRSTSSRMRDGVAIQVLVQRYSNGLRFKVADAAKKGREAVASLGRRYKTAAVSVNGDRLVRVKLSSTLWSGEINKAKLKANATSVLLVRLKSQRGHSVTHTVKLTLPADCN